MSEEIYALSSISRRCFLTVGAIVPYGVLIPHEVSSAPLVNVEDYGANTEQPPQLNLEAFRRAIANTPAGGRLLIPRRGPGEYLIDTSGGLRRALVVDRPMTILVEGSIRATYGMSRQNPPYIFSVIAPDVNFIGGGIISGPGDADDTNMSDDTSHAGLIHVTGDRFRFVGITVRDVPKIGIHLWKCWKSTISARWLGGVRNYTKGHTGLFGIRATGGGGHRIVNNRFERDSSGRRLITGYFAGGLMGGTYGDEIKNNFADVHEKIAYLYSNGSTVSRCRVVNAIQTDIVRICGSENIIDSVIGSNVKGGVSIYNGEKNSVIGCDFSGVLQSGIFVSFLGNYAGGFEKTVIENNKITSAGPGAELQDGICLYLNGNDAGGMIIRDNAISAPGRACWRNGVRIEAIPPFFVNDVTISGNSVDGAVNGISLRRVGSVNVARNHSKRLRGGQPVLRITS